VPARALARRLAEGARLLLDGATGSELQRRGVDVSKGASRDSAAWSATAIEDAPETIRSIHEDYLRLGADVITANSFATNRSKLGRVGLASRMEEFTRVAVEIARSARDGLAPDALVAGSIGPTTNFPSVAPAEALLADWGDQVAVMAEAGADLIMIELMWAIPQLLPAVEVATASGLPVFLGVRTIPAGTMASGESMDELVAALACRSRPVDAILVMCSPPDAVSATLPLLRAAFDGPIGAYANVGYQRSSQTTGRGDGQYYQIDIGENTPERYAEYGRQWRTMGAQILGGCCGTTPEHISRLRPVIMGD
jgi:methionine synthase I (cobalamin-dependent)